MYGSENNTDLVILSVWTPLEHSSLDSNSLLSTWIPISVSSITQIFSVGSAVLSAVASVCVPASDVCTGKLLMVVLVVLESISSTGGSWITFSYSLVTFLSNTSSLFSFHHAAYLILFVFIYSTLSCRSKQRLLYAAFFSGDFPKPKMLGT